MRLLPAIDSLDSLRDAPPPSGLPPARFYGSWGECFGWDSEDY
nr:MAG TPA: hypothetical protein [Caudoviricetes sp.]